MESDIILLSSIFPDEIWLMIFGKLQGANVYCQIVKASPHFGFLIHELRARLLFGSVAKILLRQANKSEVVQFLIKSRQVCANWRNGVDSVFQSVSHYHPKQDQSVNHFHTENVPGSAYFKKWSDFRKFNRHFKLTHLKEKRNPFLFRSVRIEINAPNEAKNVTAYSACLEELVDTFSIYGCHVWFLSVRYAGVADKLVVCRTIRRMLEHLPNLKVLKVFYSVRDSVRESRDKIAMTNFIRRNPMPKLKSLEIFECIGLLPFEIVKSILDGTSKESGLSKLSYLQMSLRILEPLDFLLPVSKSLKTLCLNLARTTAVPSNQDLENREKEIKFYTYLGQLQASNIWELFPYLEEISVEYRSSAQPRLDLCTREQWKQYQ